MKIKYVSHKKASNAVAEKAVSFMTLLVPAYAAASFFIIASILLRNLL